MQSLFLVLLIITYFQCIKGVTLEQDIFLTKSQVLALQDFKERVLPLLNNDYMKEDIYLAKWLKAKKFNVDKAETFLRNHLEWRKTTNFDNLPTDYFSEYEKSYPYDITGFDKEGRPLIQWYFDEWDIRKRAVAGEIDKLILYVSSILNKGWLKVRELQHQGKNVTRYTTIVNLKNVNVIQHVNAPCLPYYINVVLTFDRNFPKQGDSIFLMNTPGLFEAVLTLAKSVMDQETKESLKVYGTNMEKWRSILSEKIDSSQLTAPFGGTMPSKHGF